MANLFLNLPMPAGDGPGASVNTSAMGKDKSIVVGGSFERASVAIEVSANGTDFETIWLFDNPGKKVVEVAAQFMRVNVQGRSAEPFSAVANLGANDNGALFVNLVPPAGNGVGAAVNVATLGNYTSFVVSGAFREASVSVEVSEDGVTFAQCSKSFSNAGGVDSRIVVGNFMRVRVDGRTGNTFPFTPTVAVGAINDASAGGGAVTLQDAYDDSAAGRIVTDDLHGPFKLEWGSTGLGDDVLLVEDNVGAALFSVRGLTGQCLGSDGSDSAPTWSFLSLPNSGLTKGVGSALNMVVSGFRTTQWVAGAMLVSSTNGSASVRQVISQADPDTGFAWGNAANPNRLEIVTGGVTSIRCTSGQQNLGQDGSDPAPTWSFLSLPDSGLTKGIGNALNMVVNGFRTTQWVAGAMLVSSTNGSSAVRQLISQADTDTGFAWGNVANPNRLEMITGGTTVIECTPGQQCLGQDGVLTTPTWSFINKQDAGLLYRAARNRTEIVYGGVEGIGVDDNVNVGGTRLYLYDVDNASMEQVTVGVADSGGVGFKILRIPN